MYFKDDKKILKSYRFPTLSAAHGATLRTTYFLLFWVDEETGGTFHTPPEVRVPRQRSVSQLFTFIYITFNLIPNFAENKCSAATDTQKSVKNS